MSLMSSPSKGRLPASETGLGSVAIQVAPLAFVLHPDDDRDLESLRALVSAIRDDDLAYHTARGMLSAMRECLERDRSPDLAVFAAGQVLPPELTRAIALDGFGEIEGQRRLPIGRHKPHAVFHREI